LLAAAVGSSLPNDSVKATTARMAAMLAPISTLRLIWKPFQNQFCQQMPVL
jgi:hypothetical protein